MVQLGNGTSSLWRDSTCRAPFRSPSPKAGKQHAGAMAATLNACDASTEADRKAALLLLAIVGRVKGTREAALLLLAIVGTRSHHSTEHSEHSTEHSTESDQCRNSDVCPNTSSASCTGVVLPDEHTVTKAVGSNGGTLSWRRVTTKGGKFLPFNKALFHARALKLKPVKEWNAWCKSGARPNNVPSSPHQTYKHDGWGHWLGTITVAPEDHKFLPFKQALVCARALKLKTQKEWHAWSKIGERTVNIPACPERTYKHDGWQGYGH